MEQFYLRGWVLSLHYCRHLTFKWGATNYNLCLGFRKRVCFNYQSRAKRTDHLPNVSFGHTIDIVLSNFAITRSDVYPYECGNQLAYVASFL